MKEKIAFALIMGIVTTGIISFSLISINVGFTDQFLSIWLNSWAMAYFIVVPVILLLGPRVQSLVEILLRKGRPANQSLRFLPQTINAAITINNTLKPITEASPLTT